MQVIVDSLLINYSIQGSGKKTILFLHGWGDSLNTFKKITDELSKKYTTISIDLPGFGGSQKPQETWGLNDYSNFLKTFLKKINKENIYAIIGHSNGGAIAIEGLANNNLNADKLVLLASAGVRRTSKQNTHRIVWKIIAKIGKVLTLIFPKNIKNKLRRRMYSTAGSDLLVVEGMEDTFKRVVEADIIKDARDIKLPTLLVYGDKDEDTPLDYGEAIHQAIDDSKLEIVSGAGHFIHLDNTQSVIKKINEFLK